jgi:hypothetical protein
LVRRHKTFDIVRVQDVAAISGKSDPEMLRWATNEGRIVITHDLSTMLPAMRDVLSLGKFCAPIVLVPDSVPVSSAIEDILLLDQCATEIDWVAGVLYLPLS